jgi:hypothetical protein
VVPAKVWPPNVRLHEAVTDVLALPELVNMRAHVSGAAPALEVQEVTLAWTLAVLVNDPNRPNTKPAMAMAAMSVMAISITVARTGLIAFLLLL